MTISYAILIDGGFARHKLGSAKRQAISDDFNVLIEKIKKLPDLQSCRLHRVYYYDAMPLTSFEKMPLQGGKVDFGKTSIVTHTKQLYRELAKLPFVSLRIGEVTFNGWGVYPRILENASGPELTIKSGDLKAQIKQNGVDMRIGMDIAALTLKKHVKIIVLVASDSDFVPAIKFARREGCQLYLCTLGHGVKPVMLEHCDLLLEV
ncbi:MAG: NYN domain-containing protein [Azoarcus sp.]|jgi:uncharacterized LabA/DUF88 family protein|nr:NYN domain-containing protein [Azoarcus sp.]